VFRLSDPLPRSSLKSTVLEVTGTLEKENNRFVFRVRTVTSRSSDIDTLRSKRFNIHSDNADDWYRVSEWAKKRGAFYGDEELLKQARDLEERLSSLVRMTAG
jgi:hypothetical protein